MEKIKIQYYNSAFGELILGSFEDKLCLCDWRYRKMRKVIDERIQNGLSATYEASESPIIHETIKQLQEYFNKKREEFEIPLNLVGTEFQQKVWNALVQIPFGHTETYLSLAQKIDKVKAIRAVAAANGANAISIIVPCHRIIGSNKQLVGYAGGLQAKKKLLQLESLVPDSEQLQLFD